MGAVQFDNFVLYNNEKAGFEYKMVKTKERYTEETALIQNSVIIGRYSYNF